MSFRPEESFKSFEILDQFVAEKKGESKDAVQKRETEKVPVDEAPGSGERVRESGEEQKHPESSDEKPEQKEEAVLTSSESEDSSETKAPSESEEAESDKHSWTTKSGKKYEASMQELQNAWSLYDENKRRMSELDGEKKKLEKKIVLAEHHEKFVTEKLSKLEGNDLLKAVLEEAHKVNPKIESALQGYYDSVFSEAQKVMGMSSDQREMYEAKKKASFYENQEKQRMESEKKAQIEKSVNQRLSEIKKTWEVDDKLIDSAYSLALNKKWISEKTSHQEALETIEEIVAEYTFEQKALDSFKKLKVEADDSALNDMIDWQFRNRKAGKKELEERIKKLYLKEPESEPVKKKKPKKEEPAAQPQMRILRGNQLPEGSSFL